MNYYNLNKTKKKTELKNKKINLLKEIEKHKKAMINLQNKPNNVLQQNPSKNNSINYDYHKNQQELLNDDVYNKKVFRDNFFRILNDYSVIDSLIFLIRNNSTSDKDFNDKIIKYNSIFNFIENDIKKNYNGKYLTSDFLHNYLSQIDDIMKQTYIGKTSDFHNNYFSQLIDMIKQKQKL